MRGSLLVYIYLSTVKWHLDSALIRWNTRCEFSHVGFYDSDARLYLSAQLWGGVRLRSETGHGSYKERSTSHILLSAPQVDEAYTWARTQIGKKYDLTAITGLALNRNWRDKDSWYCSELVAEAFEQVGAPLLNPDVEVWRITPRDILLSLAVSHGSNNFLHAPKA